MDCVDHSRRLLVANPRGFCAGVDRAILTVEALLDAFGPPVFVRHAIVHNRVVVDGLAARGAVFVEEVAEIPMGAVAVISAHGAAPQVHQAALERGLRLFDATCPLVTKVHLDVARHARLGRSVFVIGHRDHVEVDGILGHFVQGPGRIIVVESEAEAEAADLPLGSPVGFVTQTTLAVEQTARVVAALRRRFPQLVEPFGEDICYATQNRQNAVRRMAGLTEAIVVIGAPHSSNSRRLCEVAEDAGTPAWLIERAEEIDPAWLDGRSAIGLTASASAPEAVVQAAIARLRALSPGLVVEEFGVTEDMVFRLAPEVRALTEESVLFAAGKAPIERGLNMTESIEAVAAPVDTAAGLNDVVRTARNLARQARRTVEDAGGLAERELAMLLNVSEKLRDRLANPKALAQGREHALFAGLRHSTHRAVDLGFDAVATGYVFTVETVENFLDQPREKAAGG
jgi:4-hydroxy-3-methylbut-2-enyl diphosphate reductase